MLHVAREKQMKTTMRHHLVSLRRAIIKKTTNNKCWQGHGEKGSLVHCWWECKLVQPPRKSVWRRLLKNWKQNYHMIQQFHSWIDIKQKWKHLSSKTYMPSNAHSNTVYNIQDTEATEMSISRWMIKEHVLYIQWSTTQP